MPIQPGAALHLGASATVAVCGQVVNEVGWGLDQALIKPVGRGQKSIDHLTSVVFETGDDGAFAFNILFDRYDLTFLDPLPPEERGGGTYGPVTMQIDGTTAANPACGAPNGIDLGDVTLPAEHLGFVEIRADDAAVPEPLAGVVASVTIADAHEWGRDVTGDDGIARVTCPLHLPADALGLSLQAPANYDGVATSRFGCDAKHQSINLDVWRTPVDLMGTVTDQQTDEAVEGAAVVALPDTLALTPGHPYVLDDDTDASGAYSVLVPWGDVIGLEWTALGYQDLTDSVGVQDSDVGVGVTRDASMPRVQHFLDGTVTDFAGSELVADLSFKGPGPAETLTNLTTNAFGGFSLVLHQGTHELTILAAGKNTRTCAVTVAINGTITMPADCLALISTGKGVVRGSVVDDLTDGALDGIDVVIGDNDQTTDLAGAYLFEVSAGENLNVTVNESFYQLHADTLDVTEDAFHDLALISLLRDSVPFTINVTDNATNEGVPLVQVCAVFVPTVGDPNPAGCQTTGSGGNTTFNLQWTSLQGGGLDTGDYAFTAERIDLVPFYDLTTCISDKNVDTTDTGGSDECVIDAVPGLPTTIGPFQDAHLAAANEVEGVFVETSLAGATCAAPYACNATTGPDGTATLVLPSGRMFSIAAAHDDFQAIADADNVSAGSSAFVGERLLRDFQSVLVTVTDAHTDLVIGNADVTAAALGFTCAPPEDVHGSFDCATTTNEDGEATLVLPWGDFDLNVPAGSYDVTLDAAFDEIETGVPFLAGTGGGLSVPLEQAVPALSAEVRLLRAPGAPITGDVLAFDGGVVPGATLLATTERFDFVCNPGDHDGPPGTAFPDCDGAGAAGAYSLTLPAGTSEDHLWTIETEAAGHFVESATNVEQGAVQDLTLWPTTFDLIVHPRDAVTREHVPFTLVCYTNANGAAAGLPQVPTEDGCLDNGFANGPLVFENVEWTREHGQDESDVFTLRTLGVTHFPGASAAALGPADNEVDVFLVPLEPEAPTFDVGVIRGIVTDADAAGPATGAPGVSVVAVADDGCGTGTYAGATGADGAYEIFVSCAGSFTVTASDAGGRYGSDAGTVDVAAGGDATSPAVATLDFSLSRTLAAASVAVLDVTTATAVAGANVSIVGLDVAAGPFDGVTDEAGVATFDDVPWGVYDVSVLAPAGDWVKSSDDGVFVVLPQAGGQGAGALASAPDVTEPTACDGADGAPDVCTPADATDVDLIRVHAAGAQGPLSGTWRLVPPQLGASVLQSSSAEITPTGYRGPHGGTWVVVYQPPPAGIFTALPTPVTVRVEYEQGGVPATLDATVDGPVTSAGPTAWVLPSLTWSFNLHTAPAETIACAPDQYVSCPDAGADDINGAAALRARFFTP